MTFALSVRKLQKRSYTSCEIAAKFNPYGLELVISHLTSIAISPRNLGSKVGHSHLGILMFSLVFNGEMSSPYLAGPFGQLATN